MQLCNAPMFGAQPWPGGTYEDLYYIPDATVPGGYRLVAGSEAKAGVFEETIGQGATTSNPTVTVPTVTSVVTIAAGTRVRTCFFLCSHIGTVSLPQPGEGWRVYTEVTLGAGLVSAGPNPWVLGTGYPRWNGTDPRSVEEMRTEESFAGAFDIPVGVTATITTVTKVECTGGFAGPTDRTTSLAHGIRGIWFE